MHRLLKIRMNTSAVMMAFASITLAACAGPGDRESLRTVNLAEFAVANDNVAESADRDDSRAAEQHIVAQDAPSGAKEPDDLGTHQTPHSQAQSDRQAGGAGAASATSDDDDRPLWPEGAARAAGLSDHEPSPGERFELYANSPPKNSNRRVVVESFVGQVYGRPIYADAFFEPIADRLIAERRRAAHERAFSDIAELIVWEHLRQIIMNELFLAEAQSQLTAEQQHGLIAMMRMMREEAISLGGGAQSAADRRWQELEGITVEEYVEAQRDVVLLRELQRRKIRPRVIVSWRDIEREYQRRYDRYNPPASVRIARIRLHSDREADRIEDVRDRFEAGESFTEIAESLGLDDGGIWQEFQLDEDGLAGIPLSDNLRQHLVGLDVGETSEPFQVGSSIWWLHVAEMERPKGHSLYEPDVQREIRHYLEQRRFEEEINKYLQRLVEQGMHDEHIEAMRRRLTRIAIQRYGP